MKILTVEDVMSITPLSEDGALKFISDNLDWYTEDYVSALSQQQILLDIAKRYLHSYEGWYTNCPKRYEYTHQQKRALVKKLNNTRVSDAGYPFVY